MIMPPAFPRQSTSPETLSPESAADLAPIQAPIFWGSGFQVSFLPNDAMIVMNAARPAYSKATGAPSAAALLAPVCAWQMSFQALKDLFATLQDVVGRYEAENGVIETEFTRSHLLAEQKSE